MSTLIDLADRPLFFELLATVGRHMRINDVPVRILASSGEPTAMVMAGYRLDDLKGTISWRSIMAAQ